MACDDHSGQQHGRHHRNQPERSRRRSWARDAIEPAEHPVGDVNAWLHAAQQAESASDSLVLIQSRAAGWTLCGVSADLAGFGLGDPPKGGCLELLGRRMAHFNPSGSPSKEDAEFATGGRLPSSRTPSPDPNRQRQSYIVPKDVQEGTSAPSQDACRTHFGKTSA
jgi:hypothetical protein